MPHKIISFTLVITTIITDLTDFYTVLLDGSVSQYPVTKIPTSKIVDTNGAGDAFIGGKLTSYKTAIIHSLK